MRQAQPLAFYIIFHLFMSWLIMSIVAGFLVSYNWYINIFSAAGILSLFSFGSYGLISGNFVKHPISHTRLYLIAFLLSLAIFCGRYGLFDFLILGSGIIQCFILVAIEWFGGKSSEKAKRKNSL